MLQAVRTALSYFARRGEDMQTYDYLIIGNSHAAVGCVEGIRSVDKTGTIAVMSGEKYHCYSRPLISYLLEGKTDLERIKYRPSDFYRKRLVTENCSWLSVHLLLFLP